MSDFASTAVRTSEESSFGVLPANPVFRELRITDTQLDATTKTVQNDELRIDLQRTGLTPVGEEAGGSIPYNLSFDNIRDPLRGVFGSNFAVNPVREKTATAANVGAVSTSGVAVLTSAGNEANSGAFTPQGIALFTGFTNAANNGIKVADVGTTATNFVGTFTAETPPVGARIKMVGYQFNLGDLVAVVAIGGALPKLTCTSADFGALGIQPGDQIKIGATGTSLRFATAALNGIVVVATVAANTLELSEVPAGWVNETSTGKNVQIWLGDSLTNGVLLKTFGIEEEAGDLGEYRYTHGAVFNSVSLSVPEAEKITGSAGILAASADAPATVRMTGASTKAPPTGEVLNGANNIGALRVDGVELKGAYITKVDVTFARDAARRGAVGAYGSTGARLGIFSADGSMDVYYEATSGRAILAKVKAGSAFSLSLFVVDPNGPNGARAVAFYIPRAQYTGAPRRNNNGLRVITPAFSGSRHASLGWTARASQFEYMEQ